jgi:tetratricopeptide (TPR) repeat protein
MNHTPLVLVGLFIYTNLLFAQPVQTAGDVFKLGVVAYQQSNYDESYKYLGQAINMDPNKYYFYYNRGMTLVAMGRSQEAMADFKKSVTLKSSAEAFYQLGLIAYQQGNLPEAKNEFENAQQLKPDMASANFYLGLIYFRDKNYAEAYTYFANCAAYNYANAEVNYYKGYCEAEQGLHDKAMKSLLFATAANSKDWKYYFKMYEAYNLLSENQLALNNISMVIELGRRKPEYYMDRATLYTATGQQALAEEDMGVANTLKAPVLTEDDHK